MENLKKMLQEGGFSCVVENRGEIRTFTSRGVADLFVLLRDDKEFLEGSRVADKIIGRGAAAILIAGGCRELHTRIISESALELLKSSDITVNYDELVPQIINREKSGICPVERLAMGEESIEVIIEKITQFLKEKMGI